jgi:hypothetical protein
MPIVDVDNEDVGRLAVVKQADSRANDFTGEFDNELVANLFVDILTSIVDIDPSPVKCIMWFNSQTIRVPFASVTGTTSYLTIGPRDHGMNRAIAAVQTGYGDPRFGTPGHTWDDLAAVITNLPPLRSLMSRILRGLLGLKGPVYKLIRHLPPCSVLEALSLIAEEYHNISPGSVSALWENWYKISYVHGSDISALRLHQADLRRRRAHQLRRHSLARERPGPGFADQLQRCVDAIRSAGGSEFDTEIALAQAMLDSPTVSRSDLVKFSKACKITGSYKFPNTSTTPGNQAFVASVYPLDRARALAEMICNVCGGRGHKGQDCASAKLTTPRPDDGASKPKTNVDREFTFRDSAGTNGRSTSKRGTTRLKRRLSAEEWADLPFIEGTTKPCSVTVGGRVCGGKHHHAKCPMLPAAKAEKAAKAAVTGKSAAIFTLPGQDPGQAPTVMRIAAAPPYTGAIPMQAPVVPAESMLLSSLRSLLRGSSTLA